MRIFSRIFTRKSLENAKSPHFYTVCKSHSDRIFRSQIESHFDRIFTRVAMARHRMPAFLHDICGARGLFLDFECCFHVQITTRIFTAFLQCETHSDFDRIFTALCACRSTLTAFLQWLARRILTAFSRGKMKKSKKGFRPHFYHAKARRAHRLLHHYGEICRFLLSRSTLHVKTHEKMTAILHVKTQGPGPAPE